MRKDIPRWIVLAIDLYVTLNTFILSFACLKLLGFRGELRFYQVVVYQLPLVFLFALIAFLVTASYKGIIRHTGFRDMEKVLQANVLYMVLIGAFYWIALKASFGSVFVFGKILLLVHFFFNTMMMVFLRIFYKNIYDSFVVGGSLENRIMIYGAGSSGVITYNTLRNDKKSKGNVFGFMDDNKNKVGKKINRVKIYDPKLVTKEFIEKHNITEIIISIQKISSARLHEIIDMYSDFPVNFKIVPSVDKWLNGDLTIQQIQPVNIEDLLGRTPIDLNKSSILSGIENKVILVTGAAGSIGSEISRQLMTYNVKKLILLDQAESDLYELDNSCHIHKDKGCQYVIGDVRNEGRMEEIIKFFKPNFIFHAAAYKHVPLMEANPYESVMTNVKGTKVVADLAVKYKVEKFVMISTDKAVNPTNVMGATKRIAELYASHLNKLSSTQFIVTRFGNVLGSNGSVIPLFKRQIREGGPLTVTHQDITRYFMTIPEACQLVLEAGVMGNGGEVFVFDMGKSVKIFDLAKKIIRLSGLSYPNDIDIKIVGLRPGEKIFEELLLNDETTIETHHPKIKIAKARQPVDDFIDKLEILIQFNLDGNPDDVNMSMVSIIKDLVPEYISQNSVFSTLDKILPLEE